MAEEAVSPHQDQVVQYLRFARGKRSEHLKEIDAAFEDVKDMKLSEDNYTLTEVLEMLDELNALLKANMATELMNATAMNVVMLRQYFSQAEKWHLRLQANVDDWENQKLISEITKFEEECNSKSFKSGVTLTKGLPSLATDPSLLNNEIARLTNANAELQKEKTALQEQMQKVLADTSGTDAAKAAEELAAQLRKELEDAKSATQRKEGALEQLREDFEKLSTTKGTAGGDVSSAEYQALQKEMLDTQTELRALLEEREKLKKELDGRLNSSTPFLNMRKMIAKKNQKIKELRGLLQEHAPLALPNADDD